MVNYKLMIVELVSRILLTRSKNMNLFVTPVFRRLLKNHNNEE
ncbi:hypothetical protein B4092_4959 [Bacillus licheniformis]|nr:hypothetical protein B4092_4959 [Bacillus licheniformis]TWN76662.1 hypothetical protein CHCC20494_0725 [Bacillus licheniformis]